MTVRHASYDKVVVPIPVHIWETIRSHPGVDLSLADASDDDLRKRVELAVDGRSASYEAAETDQQKALADLIGFIPYGAARDPRDQQIASGLDYYSHRREHQRQICAAIERLNSKESTSHAQRPT